MMRALHQKPTNLDFVILSCFVILITFQPFFLHGEINLYEVGLYLPGINAVLDGMIPYKEFFHLRGPFELYMPAAMMKAFGAHLGVLYAYFYLGTILTLLLCVLIGKELYQNRYILYLMVPVLTARTFPRVVYHIWGGMRYAFGLMAVLFAIKFFKKEKPSWTFAAGIASMCGLFTSVEIGICSILGVGAALLFSVFFRLQERSVIRKGAVAYVSGLAVMAIPYGLYLVVHGALVPYLESVYTIVTNMEKVIDAHVVSIYPSNAKEAFLAMVNPLSKNFRHMTPGYFYLVLLFFIGRRIKTKTLSRTHLSLICLGVYGIIMYNSSFRSIWAAQFEMALQPEKLLFFYVLGEGYLFLVTKKREFRSRIQAQKSTVVLKDRWVLIGIYFLFLAFFMSSVNYAIMRYDRRFVAYQIVTNKLFGKSLDELKPWAKKESRRLTIERARGMIVPKEQARELEAVIPLIQRVTKPGEAFFAYPELATYYFLADRPFLGRFPMATFSWFNEKWHKELLADLKNLRPDYVVLVKRFPQGWEEVYFAPEKNRKKYRDVMALITANYLPAAETDNSYLYRRQEGR